MKLLIVDDEELTRTGVISSLDWSSLGIDEVIQADDGVHGLETARPSPADFCQDFLDFLAPFRTKCIYLEKKMQYLVYFLFSQEAPSSHQIHAAGEYLCSHFENTAAILLLSAIPCMDCQKPTRLILPQLSFCRYSCRFLCGYSFTSGC